MIIRQSRKYIILLCLGVLAVGLASCGKKQAALTPPSTPSNTSSQASSGTSSNPSSETNSAPSSDASSTIFAVEFGLGAGRTEGVTQETSLHPGESIDFTFRVKNTSSDPVECPKVAIEPASDLELAPAEMTSWGKDGPIITNMRRKTLKNLGSGVPMQVAREGYFGISNPPHSSMGGKLNPANNKYYDSRTAALWSARDTIGLLKDGSVLPIGFSHYLTLSRHAKPATDVIFTGYIVVKGQKQAAGTVTIHVLNPD